MTFVPRRFARLGILPFLMLLVGACSDDQAGAQPKGGPPPSVTVAKATKRDIRERYEFVGQTEAVAEIELTARVEGFLVERAFEEGDDVEKGARLFAIERDEYEAAVQAAEAAVAEAKAGLERARRDLGRARSLAKRGNISQAKLDQAISDEQQAVAKVQAAEAVLRRDRLDLSYTEIVAPVDGRIGRARYDVGNLVGPAGEVLARLVTLDPIYVTFTVSEQTYLDYRQEVAAAELAGKPPPSYVPRLRLANSTEYQHSGRIDFVDNRVDPTTGTILIRSVFPNPSKLLVPGLFVTVVVESAEASPALLIPQAAVQEDQQGYFVLTATTDDIAEVRRVSMGNRVGLLWEVVDGLAEGERVIYQGIQKVRPGAKVAPVERAPNAPTDGRPS